MCLRSFTIFGLMCMLLCTRVNAAASTGLVNISIQLTPVLSRALIVNIQGAGIDAPVCVVQRVNLASKATCTTGQTLPLGVFVAKQFLGSFGSTSTNTYSSQKQSQLYTYSSQNRSQVIAPLIQNLRFEQQDDVSLEFLVNF